MFQRLTELPFLPEITYTNGTTRWQVRYQVTRQGLAVRLAILSAGIGLESDTNLGCSSDCCLHDNSYNQRQLREEHNGKRNNYPRCCAGWWC